MSKETFDFSEALRRMKEGKKVCRSCKKQNSYSIKTVGGKEVITFNDDSRIIFIDDDAILATDWMEV